MAYSLPFQVTEGVIVARAGHLPANLNELSGRQISLSAASPFLRAALSLRERISDLAVDTIPDTMGAQAIIEAVARAMSILKELRTNPNTARNMVRVREARRAYRRFLLEGAAYSLDLEIMTVGRKPYDVARKALGSKHRHPGRGTG